MRSDTLRLQVAALLCGTLLAGGCRVPARQAGTESLVNQASGHPSCRSATTTGPLIEPRPLPVPCPPVPLAAVATASNRPANASLPARTGVAPQLATFASEPDGALPATVPTAVADAWETPLAAADPSQVDRVVTIDEVLSYTFANHPLLQARQHEVEVARAKAVGAGLRRNPHFVFATETPVARDGLTELGGRVTFPILTARKRRLRKAAACTGVRRAELAVNRQSHRLLEQAAMAAVDVLYLQELVGLNAQISQLAAELSTATVSTLSPDEAELKVAKQMTAEISAAEAEAQHLDTDTQLAVARQNLARAMGLTPPATVAVAGNLAMDLDALLPLETALAMARENRPELVEAQVAVSESRQQHMLAHAEAHPDLEMGPRYAGRLGEDNDRVGVRVDVDLPLFDRNQGGIGQTAAQVRVNRAQLSATLLETLSDVATAHAELVKLQKELKYYNERVAQLTAKMTALLADPAIRRGISDLQEQTIRLALVRMRRDRLQLAYRYARLLTRLQFFLTGDRDAESFQARIASK